MQQEAELTTINTSIETQQTQINHQTHAMAQQRASKIARPEAHTGAMMTLHHRAHIHPEGMQ